MALSQPMTSAAVGAKRAGTFLSFEGVEGCGKSTQIERLHSRLKAAGRHVIRLREPGGTRLGEALRSLLQHDPAGEGMCPESELLLFATSRAQLVRDLIGPMLEDPSVVVIADRFHDSTTVYQGVGRGLDRGLVAGINQFATGGLVPDLTVLLDLDIESSRSRTESRGGQIDRMEREDDAFFARVRAGYLELAASESDRFAVVDGEADADTVEKRILNILAERIHGLLD